jgi:hypothetical protein
MRLEGLDKLKKSMDSNRRRKGKGKREIYKNKMKAHGEVR